MQTNQQSNWIEPSSLQRWREETHLKASDEVCLKEIKITKWVFHREQNDELFIK